MKDGDSFILQRPSIKHEADYLQMMEEWTAFGGRLNPGTLKNLGYPYAKWLEWSEKFFIDEIFPRNRIPQTLYFMIRERDGKIVGGICIRHYLDDIQLNIGGHMGYGIRPSERNKGYGTKVLAMGLDKCRKMGIDRARVTCDKNNAGSAKVIENNGGVFDGEYVRENGDIELSFWIETRKPTL